MTSSDVRDVLNLPEGPAGPRPSKKQKTAAPRPNLKGLAREVQNLGGDNPIAIVPEVSNFKKRRFVNRKPAAKWEMRAFKNSARDDGSLILRHWRRKAEGVTAPAETQQDGPDQPVDETSTAPSSTSAEVEESAYSKYNVQVVVPQYSDDQYLANLQSLDWTKEETDYLVDLVREFDLRWTLIWDRYEYTPKAVNGEVAADGDETKAVIPAPKPRSMEDLKARFYEVAAKMMVIQKPKQYMTQSEYNLHEIYINFNREQETARKLFAQQALTRSREEAKEEESLLIELKRIIARQDRFNEERRELYNRLDYPHTDQDISAFKSSAGLQNLLQNLMSVDKKKRRSLMDAQGISPSALTGQPPSATATNAPDSAISRRDSIVAPSSAGGHRESLSGPVQTPTTANNKKGAQAVERRKLTEAEEYVYGVSHHDRLGSGPTFRYEKINKMFTHKSNQQQMRITNTLTELDVPARLIMPTAAITAQYEQLMAAVTALLDARKLSDKIDAEMKIEVAKKAEREKTLAPPPDAAAGPATEPPASGDGTAAGDAKSGNANTAEAEAEATSAGDKPAPPAAAEATTNEDESAAASVEPREETVPTAEAGAEKEKGARPGSSSGTTSHKRSASVLSTVSDKSAKRQKK